jgi:D-glycero-alpha-D-manno-heptose 1-phosphate guanylyltransferase
MFERGGGESRCGIATAVILAGGRGTRIEHLLPGLPKAMAPINGRPFLEWSLRYLAWNGIDRIVLSTGHLAEAVERHFKRKPLPGVELLFAREDFPLGTAGGFLHAAGAVARRPGPWLVANGDSLLLADLAAFVARFRAGSWAGAILGLNSSDASRYGTVETDPAGRLLKFSEKRPGPGLINAGFYLFCDSALAQFPQKTPLSFETEVFPFLLDRGAEILVHRVEAPFLDIGTPASLAEAGEFVRRHLQPLLEKTEAGLRP